MMEFNFLFEQRAIMQADGRYRVDYTRMPSAIERLAKELLEQEAAGDRSRAEAWFSRYDRMPPALAKAASSDLEFSARSIYNLAIQGNADAQRIFQRFGQALGILLADLVNILDLDMFVIGGGVVSAWEAFAPKMFAELRERSLVYAASAPEDSLGKKQGASAQITAYAGKRTMITRALLGSDAGLYGAARIPGS